jgi:PIN domain nuclease of toxin-antitoxin system
MGSLETMKLLLDTHIWLRTLLEPRNLTREVARELENPANELWLSPISTWELLILVEKGRVVLAADPVSWVRDVFRKIPFNEASLNRKVAIQSREMELPQQNRADRFLAATAFVYDLTLVTADDRLFATRGISTLANK